MKRITAFLAIIALAVVLWIGLDVHRKVFEHFPGFAPSKIIRIEPGMSVDQAAGLLYRNRIIGSLFYFKVYYRLFYSSMKMKSGDYLFDRPLTMRQVIDKLHEGRVVLLKITVKEGWTVEEIGRYLEDEHILRAADFLKACGKVALIGELDPNAIDLEGYLFPDTYLVPKDISALDLVDMMVKHFRRNITNEVRWRARDIHFTIREVIVLASLIEKETASRDERFFVSSVFHNRLHRQMLLDCDPTIIYALKKEKRYSGKLGWGDLKFDSPYNTRLHRGLPPGPICNPGWDSIEASLYPENTNYLYFVAKNHEGHQFSETLDEHNRAVKKYITGGKGIPSK